MEEILHQAEQSEKEYDWSGAAESYEKALNLLSQDDFSKRGEIQERLGYALYRTAFQAESSGDFRERMRQAVEDYEKAKGFHEKMGESGRARAVRCDALIAFSSSWLT